MMVLGAGGQVLRLPSLPLLPSPLPFFPSLPFLALPIPSLSLPCPFPPLPGGPGVLPLKAGGPRGPPRKNFEILHCCR